MLSLKVLTRAVIHETTCVSVLVACTVAQVALLRDCIRGTLSSGDRHSIHLCLYSPVIVDVHVEVESICTAGRLKQNGKSLLLTSKSFVGSICYAATDTVSVIPY